MPTARPPVTLDLDTLEREDTPELFTVKLGKTGYTLCDPDSLPWRALVDDDDPDEDGARRIFLTTFVAEDQREAFSNAVRELPNWKVTRLVQAYNKHYKLGDQGEGSGSSTS